MSGKKDSNSSNPQAGLGVPLPKKEMDLFRQVVRLYETKQYKKGLKLAESILKKFPKHGETLCMKGLVLNSMDKANREDAIATVKLGLMNDMRSHVCWHVYGLIYRSERNYNEAIKAYKQALRIDTQNIQILKDLALLQIQMRDFEGFAKTQHTILELKPNLKQHWIGFAIAKHLLNDHRGAVNVIDIFLGTLDPSSNSPDLSRNYETSELALYKNQILAEIPNNFQEALDHLEQVKDLIVDETSRLERKGYYQLMLGHYEEAKLTFEDLFHRGLTENYQVHSGYMCAVLNMDEYVCNIVMSKRNQCRNGGGSKTLASMVQLTEEQKQILLHAYTCTLMVQYPKSVAMKRISLTLYPVGNDEWIHAIEEYMQLNIIRGVPSLGEDLSAFYLVPVQKDDSKPVLLELTSDPTEIRENECHQHFCRIVNEYISSLSISSTFHKSSSDVQPPSALLWVWYLRAILFEHVAEYTSALQFVDKCLEHTPTLVDVYELKARLLQKDGSLDAAVLCIDKGRELDLQDRYINNQTVKYMLQAGQEKDALDRMALFTRHESDPEQNIFDMQVSWYELELAACYERKKDYGRSLKKYVAVEKHFEDFYEDQFDFHSYCIRKVTLRSYVDTLRWEDRIWGHDFYVTAAEGIIRNYIHLYDNPNDSNTDSEPDFSSMTSAERKKVKAELRKKKIKAEKEDETSKDATKKGFSDQKKKEKKVDPDPDGLELLKKDPLEELRRYTANLVKNAPNRISTWLYQYDVAIRRHKATMALRALLQAKKIFDQSSDRSYENQLFSRISDFSTSSLVPKNDTVNKVFEPLKKMLLV